MFGTIASKIASYPLICNSFISSSSSSSTNGRNSKVLISNIPPVSKIFIKNLSYTTGEASLIKLFSKFGPIVEVKIAKHEETNRSKGYAFVHYTCLDDAILAIEHMDQKIIDGRVVHAEIAKPSTSGFGGYPKSLGPPLHQNLEAKTNSDDHIKGDHSQQDEIEV